jgi:hypothetical protein
MRVTGFAVRPNPFLHDGHMVTFVRKPLEGTGFDTERKVVDVVCKGARGYELGVELVRTSKLGARAQALEVHYRSSDEDRTLRVRFRIGLT